MMGGEDLTDFGNLLGLFVTVVVRVMASGAKPTRALSGAPECWIASGCAFAMTRNDAQ
jgi:hypothetical protein